MRNSYWATPSMAKERNIAYSPPIGAVPYTVRHYGSLAFFHAVQTCAGPAAWLSSINLRTACRALVRTTLRSPIDAGKKECRFVEVRCPPTARLAALLPREDFGTSASKAAIQI